MNDLASAVPARLPRLHIQAAIALYGTPPGKHEQLVEGAPQMINLYTKRDKPMVEKAMLEFQAQRCEGGHGRTLVQLWKI